MGRGGAAGHLRALLRWRKKWTGIHFALFCLIRGYGSFLHSFISEKIVNSDSCVSLS